MTTTLTQPIERTCLLAEVEATREACAADGYKVLRMLALCLSSDIPPPRWLSDAYVSKLAQVQNAQVGTLDGAFGKPWPPGTRLHDVRNQKRLQEAIHRAVWALAMAEPDIPLDRALFKRIGVAAGIHKSASQAQRLYYQALDAGAPSVALLRKRERAEKSHVMPPLMRLDSLLHSTPAPSL